MELVYLYSLRVELKPFLLVDQEFLDVLALITLKLDHLAHLSIVDDGAIARCCTVYVSRVVVDIGIMQMLAHRISS